MEQAGSSFKAGLSKTRTVAAWTALLAFVSMFVAENLLTTKYSGGPWPEGMPRPSLLEWLLIWRNVSFIVALVTGLISLPRWQSLVGLSLTLVYTYFVITSY